MNENMKLIKIATLDYEHFIRALMALDHLRTEYMGYLTRCEEIGKIDDLIFWTEQIAVVDAAVASFQNARLEMVEITPMAVTQ